MEPEVQPVETLLAQLAAIARQAVRLAPMLVIAAVVLGVTWLAARLLSRLMLRVCARAKLRRELQEVFALLTSIGVWVIGLMIAAVVVFPNLTPASMLTTLGIGSLAVGFAFKDIFENFLAGIFILFRREMRIGDFVEHDGNVGAIERITIRETHMRQTDGQLVIIPNATLFKNPLTIVTDQPIRRTTVICGVAYREDVDAARQVIHDAVKGCKTVVTDGKPIQIFAQEFAESSVNFEVTWWTGSKPVDIRRSRDEVVAAVKRALDDAGIEIPYPYRTLSFPEPLAIRRNSAADNGR